MKNPKHAGFDYSQSDLNRQSKSSNTKIVLAVIFAAAGGGLLLIIGGGLFVYFQFITDGSKLKTVASNDGLVEISVPGNWTTTMSLSPDASIEVANIFTENYAIVITESKSDFTDGSVPLHAAVETVEGYGRLVSNQMTEGSELRKTVLKPSYSINGRDAVLFRFKGQVDGIPVVYWLGVVDGKKHFHQIMTWTLTSREDRNKEKLLAVIDSFREP